jgi:hypothetical protein
METLGFRERSEAELLTLTQDVFKSSEIEGETLPPEQVRSSIARRLCSGEDGLGGGAGRRVWPRLRKHILSDVTPEFSFHLAHSPNTTKPELVGSEVLRRRTASTRRRRAGGRAGRLAIGGGRGVA